MKKTLVLSLMMFLEYLMFAVWFVPIVPYVRSLEGGASWVFWCGTLMGIGTLTSPVIGMFADRYLNAERVLALCYLVSGTLLSAAFFVKNPAILFVLLLGVMLAYMPTWSLTITIALVHAPASHLARIRAMGTIGWIATGGFSAVAALCGYKTFDSSAYVFLTGAGVTFLATALTFLLPKTEPQAKGAPLSVIDALGLRALVLFKDRTFRPNALIFLFATIPYLWYLAYGSDYLKDSGFQYLTLTMNLGQVGEIGFLLLVPWIMRKFGLRNALLLAFAAIVFRNICFALSSSGGSELFNFGGILIHGLIFGLITLGGQIFVNDASPKELRNQAQGLMNVLMTGVGVFLSNGIFHLILTSSAVDGNRGWTTAYLAAIAFSVVGALLTVIFLKRTKAEG